MAITGISGASTLSGNPIRMLRPRHEGDVQITRFNAAFVFYDNRTDAQSYENMLDTEGIPTDLVYVKSVGATDFSKYHVILIGSDVDSWNATDVKTILAANTPIVAIGAGGALFLDQVTTPDLYIGWGHSAGSTDQTHAIVFGGDIYSYPYTIPKSPGDNIYLYYTPGSAVHSLHDPDGVTDRMLRHFSLSNYYPLASEIDRFYQWGFYGSPAGMTGYGRQIFVNLLYSTLR
ncbi:MAG: hypothetical protein A2Z18_08460 [Armatimonadetes bacterium RBG_16_58_9]|nr:MAG: hypothetical protein A2Z18_08460 [Armatimonadetes bacterium RBG_16_58_9]